MHSMGVSTTRSLSLVVSGKDKVQRQWYSGSGATPELPDVNDPRLAHLPMPMRRMLIEQLQGQSNNPDIVVNESCAITCRVAPSFLRVGQVELFARRARRGEHHQELEAIVEHLLFREYPAIHSTNHSLQDKGLAMLRECAQRFQRLTADWIRVGYELRRFIHF